MLTVVVENKVVPYDIILTTLLGIEYENIMFETKFTLRIISFFNLQRKLISFVNVQSFLEKVISFKKCRKVFCKIEQG